MKNLLLISIATCFSLFSAKAQIITTVVGNGTAGSYGNGGQATAATLNEPSGVYRTRNGNLYVVEYGGNVVRKIDPSGIISLFAGNGTAGYSGDHGPATAASFNIPIDITFDKKGNAYVVDNVNSAIRKIDTFGIITTFAGTGMHGYSGDHGPATNALLYWPDRVGHDEADNIYIADAQNNVVRKVDTNGIITTVAGTGVAGFSGDNGPATTAMLNWTLGVAFDANGNMYIADGSNHRVRKVDPYGIITTFAGNGINALTGDSGPATDASFELPGGVAVDGGCNVYVSDFYGNNVRKIYTSGIIETVVDASDVGGFSGDHGLSTLAEIHGPDNITFDTSYSIYLADFYNNRVRMVEKIGANTGCPPVMTPMAWPAGRIELSVFPNPASSLIRLQLSGTTTQNITLQIMNSLGETVMRKNIKDCNGDIELGIEDLPSGLYSVGAILESGQMLHSKFLVE